MRRQPKEKQVRADENSLSNRHSLSPASRLRRQQAKMQLGADKTSPAPAHPFQPPQIPPFSLQSAQGLFSRRRKKTVDHVGNRHAYSDVGGLPTAGRPRLNAGYPQIHCK